jgi:hypothetical protein
MPAAIANEMSAAFIFRDDSDRPIGLGLQGTQDRPGPGDGDGTVVPLTTRGSWSNARCARHTTCFIASCY